MKILVCMGYYEGDKQLSIDLVEQIGKLLSAKSEIVSLCYVFRHDSSPPDPEILRRDREKFHDVYSARCDFKGTGWPGGCNAIAYSILNTILPKSDKAIECALILESDCVITRKDWDAELWEEWKKAKAAKKQIVGTILPWAHQRGASHVNASALYGRKVARHLGSLRTGRPMSIAWDFYYGSNTTLLAMDSPLFKLDWQRETITDKELFGSGALVFHGCKDNSAREAVRKRFKL